jgi:GT2 family glycosyltransferase
MNTTQYEIKISASIVLYKTEPSELHNVYKCFLESLVNFRLILVDNSPDDRLRNIIIDENVKYIYQGNNIGYGRGHNIALKNILDNSDFHLVLNSDISFKPDVIGSLIAYMLKHAEVGLIMPKVLYPNGETQYLCKLIPTPFDLIFRRFLPASVLKKRKEKFQLLFTGYDKIMEVPYLSGCFMFLRTASIKEVGLFDERFFMYPEDIDLTRRINEKYKTIYFPEVFIIHDHAKESYKRGDMLLIHATNIIKYFNKWGWFFDLKRVRTNQNILRKLNYER